MIMTMTIMILMMVTHIPIPLLYKQCLAFKTTTLMIMEMMM